jgi:rod shape-determining protein MreC
MARIAALRALAQRFSFALLLMAAVGVMMLGKVDTVVLDGLRTRLTDAVAPILDVLSRPAGTVADAVDWTQQLTDLRRENARLRAENEALLRFEQAAFRLQAENEALRSLANYHPATPHAFVTARVVGDNSGAFVRSLMINLGTQNGIADGQAVMGARGLVGRIVQAGERSARLLLVTDLNARIPVLVGAARHRAILGGENTDRPRLLYLRPESDIGIGDRVSTSGHGGMFPPDLPVGVVTAVADGAALIEPFEDLSRLEYVRIMDFRPYVGSAALRPGVGHPR